MFTGIISEIGEVRGILPARDGVTIKISCPETSKGVSLGDSVSVNGVCLTVSGKEDLLSFDVVKNTLSLTNLKRLRSGSRVNIENAIKAGDKLSGHIVSGHIDGERKIRKNTKNGSGWVLEVVKQREDAGMTVEKGSVAVDGVSLTIGHDDPGFFRIFIIPYTLAGTTIPERKIGDMVNVEYDILGKYARGGVRSVTVTEKKLRENGFI
ncbi:MAG TPA: riboflavin synthase [Candidatus Omnitrophota bacterium]|nr:riboflavin synthase [Candidatus Omnitrophota bacterium]